MSVMIMMTAIVAMVMGGKEGGDVMVKMLVI